MIPKTIDAGTSATLTAAFLDADGNPQTPSAVFATIKSLAPPATLRVETELDAPASSMEIPITSTENASFGGFSLQPRQVVLRAVYGDDDELVTHFEYMVRKL